MRIMEIMLDTLKEVLQRTQKEGGQLILKVRDGMEYGRLRFIKAQNWEWETLI